MSPVCLDRHRFEPYLAETQRLAVAGGLPPTESLTPSTINPSEGVELLSFTRLCFLSQRLA